MSDKKQPRNRQFACRASQATIDGLLSLAARQGCSQADLLEEWVDKAVARAKREDELTRSGDGWRIVRHVEAVDVEAVNE